MKEWEGGRMGRSKGGREEGREGRQEGAISSRFNDYVVIYFTDRYPRKSEGGKDSGQGGKKGLLRKICPRTFVP
jgi:hypothetical protein